MTKVVMSEYVVIPTRDYPMQAVDYKLVESKYGKQYQWTMEFCADAEFPEGFEEELPKGTEIRDLTLPMWTQIQMVTKNKLGKFAAACGFALEPGDELDLDDLLQERVMAAVVVKSLDDGSEVSRIISVKQPKRAKAKTKAEEKATPVKVTKKPVDAGEDIFEND